MGIIGVMVLRRAARASVSVVQYTSDQVHLWWAIALLCGSDQDRGGAVHMTVGLGNSGSGGEIVLSAGASSFAAGVDVSITS